MLTTAYRIPHRVAGWLMVLPFKVEREVTEIEQSTHKSQSSEQEQARILRLIRPELCQFIDPAAD